MARRFNLRQNLCSLFMIIQVSEKKNEIVASHTCNMPPALIQYVCPWFEIDSISVKVLAYLMCVFYFLNFTNESNTFTTLKGFI